jgi:RNA polymerase sigma factor (sigma-70 family)
VAREDVTTATLVQQLKELTVAPDDSAAWETFYRSLWPAVFAIHFRQCSGNREDAQDLCQDTLIYLLRRIGPVRSGSEEPIKTPHPDYFYHWLRRICRQRYVDFLRLRLSRQNLMIQPLRSLRNLDPTLVAGKEASPERIVAGREALQRLRSTVLDSETFSELEKELFRRLMTGGTLAEIADSRENLKTLYVRFHRLRQKLLAESDRRANM